MTYDRKEVEEFDDEVKTSSTKKKKKHVMDGQKNKKIIKLVPAKKNSQLQKFRQKAIRMASECIIENAKKRQKKDKKKNGKEKGRRSLKDN